jgi:hypothetical protein
LENTEGATKIDNTEKLANMVHKTKKNKAKTLEMSPFTHNQRKRLTEHRFYAEIVTDIIPGHSEHEDT